MVRSTKFRAASIAALLGLNLCGCIKVGPDFVQPKSAVETNWQRIPADISTTGTADASAFWAEFHDETLLQMLALADENSPTLKSAVELVTQARAQARIDTGNLLPNVTLSGNRGYSQPTAISQFAGRNEGSTTDQLLGQLSWELDFWGQLRRQLEADRASLQAATAGVGAARASLEASVASAYCNLRMTEVRIAVAQRNLTQQAEDKRIAEAKYRQGATSELDFRQAETQYEQTNAQLPGLRQLLEEYRHSLSVLVGEPPDYFSMHESEGAGLPAAPTALPIGAPRDLLRRRPDVLQAEFNAAAQSARIGVAQAALYPTFTLTGEFGYANTGSVNNLFRWDNRAIQYGAGFTLPIFDRGKLKSQVRIEDSLFRQSVLAYQNQVLTAQQDVEDGLSAVQGQQGQLEDLQRADTAAQRAAKLALLRYLGGETDYTTVSSAEQTHSSTSDSLVQAQGGVLLAYINVFRALGGGWEPGAKQ